jgi:hypothetical protein
MNEVGEVLQSAAVRKDSTLPYMLHSVPQTWGAQSKGNYDGTIVAVILTISSPWVAHFKYTIVRDSHATRHAPHGEMGNNQVAVR